MEISTIKNPYAMFAVLTILLFGSTFLFSQVNALEEKNIFVTKKFVSVDKPNLVSSSLLICAGNESLSNPEILVTSDTEAKILIFNGNIKEDSCRGATVLIDTNNFSSISAEFISYSDPFLVDDYAFDMKDDFVHPNLGPKNILDIPDWFEDPVRWYADGIVSEQEITHAIDYLL